MTRRPASQGSAAVAPGARLRARIDRLVYQGSGMGRLPDGRVFFAPYTAPGDEVELELRGSRGDFTLGEPRAILVPSPLRTAPSCPYFGSCGGCQWQHLAYPAQLEWKRRVLEEQLARVGKLQAPVVAPIAPLAPWAYRARVQLKVAGTRRPLLGFHRRETNEVIDVERCPLLDPRLEAALRALRRLRTPALTELLPGLREIWLTAGTGSGEVLVSCFAQPRERGALRLLLHALRDAVPAVCGVVALTGAPRESPRVVDWQGARTLMERVGEARFRIDPTAFFQVSGVAAESLTALVLAAAGLRGSERVLDLHCGVGTFTVPLARGAREVLGAEAHPAAAQDASHNLAANGCRNARVVNAPAERALAALGSAGHWDVAVLDPPRQGCSPELLQRLTTLAPRTLVYVSCDPSTLARDLGRLTRMGWRCGSVQPVDLFPQTFHLEAVARLERAASACVSAANPR